MYLAGVLVRRLAQGIFIMFLTSLIIFTLLRVVPGDPVRLIVGGMAPENVIEEVATKMGLRDPIIVRDHDQRESLRVQLFKRLQDLSASS